MKAWASRGAEALLTLWLLVTLCFVLLRAAPGGPFDAEKAAPPEVEAALAEQYRLDQPLPMQYVYWVADVVRGDLGPSFQYPDYRVSELLAAAMPITVLNGSLALLLALGLGVPLGVWAALRAGSWTDRALMFGAGLGLSIPKFVVAPLLVLVFAVGLQWLPAGGWDGSWRSVVLPVVAWLSPALINVVSGSAVVEQVFGIPGIGRYFVQGALNRDYTLVLGVVLVVGAAIVVINALVDWLRARMDPRLRDAM